MNILVTGSGGYLGSRLAEYLVKKHEVRIILSPSSILTQEFLGPHISTVDADWSNPQGMDNATKGIDVVVHSYGLNAVECENSFANALIFNSVHTANLLEAAIKNNVKQFIYLSSAHVYGNLEGYINEKKK